MNMEMQWTFSFSNKIRFW